MRLDTDTFREIADSLVRNKRRSLLTGFGVFWGLFMLLFLIGGGAGLKEMLSKNFAGFANNTVILISSNTSKPYKGLLEGRYWNFEYKDVERLRQMVPELDVVAPMISAWSGNVAYGSHSSSASVKGITADYDRVETSQIKYGRFINEMDVEQERKVCVIGKDIYNELFPDGGDPCGNYVEVGGIHLRVIGVDFSSGNMSINGRASRTVTMPITVAAKIYHRGNTVDIICITGKSGVKMTSLEGRLRSVMGRQHSFDPTDEQAMVILNTQQIFSIVDNLFRGLNFLVWLVGLGTLLAGAIGVSNIMMVTVKERTVEIGIRRAIGALPGEILSQILMESVSLTLLAGSFGIVFSVLMLSGLEAITKHEAVFQIGFGTAIVAALLLAFLGALAGLAPALRAMNIKPVEAMHDE
ncbi:MAG: ABC transporter permease [Bacteroidaceae bacterium]|nr:ABC transporter permease [Bacteroidaceae bacterium]